MKTQNHFSSRLTQSLAISTGVLLSVLPIASLSAATSVWNTTTGSWSVGTNWSPSGVPTFANDTVLEFGNTGALYTSTNDIGPLTVNTIKLTGSGTGGNGGITLARTLSTSGLAFAGTNAQIVFDSTSSAAKTLNTSLVLNSDLTVTSSVVSAGNLTFNGAFTGPGKLIINYTGGGTGAVVLNQSFNSTNPSGFGGGVDLISGRLALQRADSLGTGAFTVSGGRFRTTASPTVELSYANVLNLAGNATVFEVISGSNANANVLSFTGGGTVRGAGVTRTVTLGNADATLTLGGAFTDDGGTGNGLSFAGSGGATLGNGVSDTAANTYSGATGVTAAGVTLRLNKAAGTNAVAGDLDVSAGNAFWQRSNQVADTSALSVTNDGLIAFAASAGSTTGFSETVASLNVNSATVAFANDSLLTVTDGVTLTNASLDLTGFTPGTDLAGGTVFVFLQSATTITGSFLGYSEGHTFDLNGNTFVTSYQLGTSGHDFGFVLGVIPEPSTAALFAGAVVLTGAVVLRRRRKA